MVDGMTQTIGGNPIKRDLLRSIRGIDLMPRMPCHFRKTGVDSR
jgi:hypothetical protein